MITGNERATTTELRDGDQVLDFVEAVVGHSSLEQVWAHLCEAMDPFGFDRLLYGYTRFGSRDSLGDFEDALFLHNHDPIYFERFIKDKMFLHAPMFRWARSNTGTCGWGKFWDDPTMLRPEERRVVAFNRSMNVVAGYTISFSSPIPRTFAMISLTARNGLSQADVDGIWQHEGRMIEALANIAHLKILSLPHTTERGRLTTRQLEVLGWVGEGKSHQDIAQILGVSVPTVEKHLRLAREKLGVATTAQAILKASFQNQIYVL